MVSIQELIYLKKMNLDEDKSIGPHWIAMYFNNNNISYFDSFGVEHIPERNLKTHRKQKCNNKYL